MVSYQGPSMDDLKMAGDELSRHQKRELVQYVSESERRSSKKMKYLLKEGDEVNVWEPRAELEQIGKVVKVSQTRAIVEIEGTRYNVPFELISIIKKAA